MSKSVVTAAAAAAHAKGVVQKNLGKNHQAKKPAQDDQQAVEHKEDTAQAVQTESQLQHQTSMSEGTLGGFSFAGALADAAASAAALTSDVTVQSDGGSSDDGDGSGTILLVGAVALVGGGIAALAGGGGGDDVDANPNTAPVLAEIAVQATNEEVAKTFTVSATDADSDTLTYTVGTATGGTAAISGTTVTFTPTADFVGAGSVVVNVSDGKGGTDSQTVTVNVADVNDAPRPGPTNATTITTNEDTPAEFIIDFSDPEDGDVGLVTQIVTAPLHGDFDSQGRYVPDANFSGTDSFSYRVLDADGAASATVTVGVTVNAVNDAPVLAAIAAQGTDVDAPVAFAVTATDVDGPTPLVFSVGSAVGGAATVAGGVVTFTPNAGFTGAASVVVTVADSANPALTDTQTVNITVAEGAGGPTPVSIDVGNPFSDPAKTNITLADGAFALTDSATANTFVNIINFTSDDVIEVSGVASLGGFAFSSAAAPGADDLVISFTGSNGTRADIVIENVVLNDAFVVNLATAIAAVGHEFITIA